VSCVEAVKIMLQLELIICQIRSREFYIPFVGTEKFSKRWI